MSVIFLGLLVLYIVARWKLFEKAGYEGWASIVPFYGTYIYCKLGKCVNLFKIYIGLWIVSTVGYIMLIIACFAMLGSAIGSSYSPEMHGYHMGTGFYGVLAGLGGLFFVLVCLVCIALLIGFIVIPALMNVKVAKTFTEESLFTILGVIGAFHVFWIAWVIGISILGFDDKYQYKEIKGNNQNNENFSSSNIKRDINRASKDNDGDYYYVIRDEKAINKNTGEEFEVEKREIKKVDNLSEHNKDKKEEL